MVIYQKMLDKVTGISTCSLIQHNISHECVALRTRIDYSMSIIKLQCLIKSCLCQAIVGTFSVFLYESLFLTEFSLPVGQEYVR